MQMPSRPVQSDTDRPAERAARLAGAAVRLAALPEGVCRRWAGRVRSRPVFVAVERGPGTHGVGGLSQGSPS
jgi:hypothetical protein